MFQENYIEEFGVRLNQELSTMNHVIRLTIPIMQFWHLMKMERSQKKYGQD